MPQRESIGETTINKWKGVNQRVQPTLVPDGFFSSSFGVYFGLGDNAQRLPGKVLKSLLAGPVFHIKPWGGFAIVQLKDSVIFVSS